MPVDALLRIEKPVRPLPSPFEQVLETVWVLEIPVPPKKKEEDQFRFILAYLKEMKRSIRIHSKDATVFLHLAIVSDAPRPFTLPEPLISIASDLRAAVEFTFEIQKPRKKK